MAYPQPRRSDTEAVQITVDWGLAFSQPATNKALSYWRSLCGARKMPERGELSPQAMRAFLTYVNLVDVVAGPVSGSFEYRVSLQGQHARGLHGHVAHRKLVEALPRQAEQRWRYCFETVRQAARPARFRSLINGKQWLEGELLVAPLGNEKNGIESLFCVLVSWRADGTVA
jgi:hypothetical protein